MRSERGGLSEESDLSQSLTPSWTCAHSICKASDRKEPSGLTGRSRRKWIKKVKGGGGANIDFVLSVHKKGVG